jgi:hypothetical protein
MPPIIGRWRRRQSVEQFWWATGIGDSMTSVGNPAMLIGRRAARGPSTPPAFALRTIARREFGSSCRLRPCSRLQSRKACASRSRAPARRSRAYDSYLARLAQAAEQARGERTFRRNKILELAITPHSPHRQGHSTPIKLIRRKGLPLTPIGGAPDASWSRSDSVPCLPGREHSWHEALRSVRCAPCRDLSSLRNT